MLHERGGGGLSVFMKSINPRQPTRSAKPVWTEQASWVDTLCRHINPLPDDKTFDWSKIETNCRQHFKVHLK